MVNVGLAVPDVGKREEPASQRLELTIIETRDAIIAMMSHLLGA